MWLPEYSQLCWLADTKSRAPPSTGSNYRFLCPRNELRRGSETGLPHTLPVSQSRVNFRHILWADLVTTHNLKAFPGAAAVPPVQTIPAVGKLRNPNRRRKIEKQNLRGRQGEYGIRLSKLLGWIIPLNTKGIINKSLMNLVFECNYTCHKSKLRLYTFLIKRYSTLCEKLNISAQTPRGRNSHTHEIQKKNAIVRQFQRQNYYVALCHFFFLHSESQVFAKATGRWMWSSCPWK